VAGVRRWRDVSESSRTSQHQRCIEDLNEQLMLLLFYQLCHQALNSASSVYTGYCDAVDAATATAAAATDDDDVPLLDAVSKSCVKSAPVKSESNSGLSVRLKV